MSVAETYEQYRERAALAGTGAVTKAAWERGFRSFAEKLGDVSIWQEEGFGQWLVEVVGVHNGTPLALDLDRGFDTPGAALDGAIAWAEQRGLEVEWMAHRFHLIRPGSLESNQEAAQ